MLALRRWCELLVCCFACVRAMGRAKAWAMCMARARARPRDADNDRARAIGLGLRPESGLGLEVGLYGRGPRLELGL